MNFSLIRLLSSRFSTAIRTKGFFSFSKAVAFVSVMLGSMALVLSLSVLSGFEESLHGIAARFSAHIQLHPHRSLRVLGADHIVSSIMQRHPDVVSSASVIQIDALVHRKAYTEGVLVKSDDRQSQIGIAGGRRILAGSELNASDLSRSVLIGKKLARKLACSVGDTIILTLARNGMSSLESVRTVPFAVRGIYETGMSQYDDVYIYANGSVLARALGTEKTSDFDYIELWLRDATRSETVARELERQFDYECETLSIDELHRGMFAWIELQKRPVPIVLGLISIVAVFNILTTLLISVVEKSSSYAILSTLGLRRRDLLATIAWQGLVIALLGTLCGCTIAATFCILQQQFGIIHLDGDIYFLTTLPVRISILHYFIVISVSLLLSLFATLVPGFIASRITPVDALRFK